MIGRPEKCEAAPYYFTYIDRVRGEDPLAAMESQTEEFLRLVSSISEEKSLYRYAPGKWSIRQVLNHVSDTERVNAFRALWFARGFESPLPGFEQDLAASASRADQVPWAEHVEEFRRVRLASISLFRNAPSEAWRKTGIANNNSFTVRALAFIIAGHLSHHAAILRERYF